MKSRAILVCIGLFVGSLAAAQTKPVEVTVGTAGTEGHIGFNLLANDGSSLPVQVAVSAGDSGSTIAGKIATAVTSSTWAASVDGAGVKFTHFNGSGWTHVAEIDGVNQTANASVTLTTTGSQSAMDLSLNPNVVASGYDPHGSPSFLTLHVSGEIAPFTMVLRPGQSPSSIMDAIVQYLESARHGLSFKRISPTEVYIHLRFGKTFASLQTSDVGLQTGTSLSGKSVNPLTGLIDR